MPFTVEFDTNGNIIRVVDVNGVETLFANFIPINTAPVIRVRAVTTTQVFVANSCYVYQNGRRVQVC